MGSIYQARSVLTCCDVCVGVARMSSFFLYTGELSFPNVLRTAFLWTFPVTTFKSVLPLDSLTTIYEGLAWHHKVNVISERETLIPDNQRINIAILHGMCILRKGKFYFGVNHTDTRLCWAWGVVSFLVLSPHKG